MGIQVYANSLLIKLFHAEVKHEIRDGFGRPLVDIQHTYSKKD